MRLVLLGPPASGKGTQAALLAAHLRLPAVSTGVIIRSEIALNTELGQRAEALLADGKLLDDASTVAIVRNWLKARRHDLEFIMDGFPRTIPQGESFRKMLREEFGTSLDAAVYLNVPHEVLRDRILGRLQCLVCGAVYQQQSHGVKEDDLCSECEKGKLAHRSDDTLETFEQRMLEYHTKTAPLVGFYEQFGKLITITGAHAPETVKQMIVDGLKRLSP